MPDGLEQMRLLTEKRLVLTARLRPCPLHSIRPLRDSHDANMSHTKHEFAIRDHIIIPSTLLSGR